MPTVVVLLPARNEEEGIGEVIDRIPITDISEQGYETIVVVADGNSEDKTREIARERGAIVIEQKGPVGKGNGVREALEHIFNSEEIASELVIMLDSDATYRPEDLPRFIEKLQVSDVVWGSRLRGNMEKNAMSRVNRIGNIILSLSASIVYFTRTTDLCTGYWGFRSKALRKLDLIAEGFSLEADLFASVSKSKLKTDEIAIDYAHREGQSSLTWYLDGPRILMMVIKRRFY
tara:strand:- start:1499 stop:2197 length:699 start_codon:yes stop_codon:yes gene_type:complete